MKITDRYISANDGLKLHVRDFMPDGAKGAPVLCLPGLTRNHLDFEVPARAIAGDAQAPRRVLAFDYRGRGLSDRDPTGETYTVPAEAMDVLSVLDALGIASGIILGSSRGGLIAMTLALMRPAVLAGVCLNDIGPVVDLKGLLRIQKYAGKLGRPSSWEEAAAQQKALFGPQFPALTDEDFAGMARRMWFETNGRFEPSCDPKVARALADISPDMPLPPIWDLYDALPDIPLMAIRGALTDLISEDTIAEMKRRRPNLDVLTVEGQGHTPLLTDAASITRLKAFIARCP